MRLAVAGKGGAGKSVLAGTPARDIARRGHRVLALDSDLQVGLSISLGASVPDEPPLLAAAERGDDGRWRLRRGIGPVRAIQRCATPAPDGVLLLHAGKSGTGGKGKVGKTTVAGTLARAVGRSGHDVLALDCDANPMLGISLGVGPEETDRLLSVRQAVDAGEVEHAPTTTALVERFGADAPDGVRLVVASRIDRLDPG